jgi:hypothetical protein
MAEYQAGHYDSAAEKLLQVYATVPLPSSARNAARAVAKQGKLVKATQLYLDCVRMQPSELWRANLQQTAQAECEQERSALLTRVARLSVVLHGATYSDVTIRIDNEPVPAALNSAEQLLDPGAHHITAERGEQTVAQDLELSEGQRSQAELTFESPAVAPVPEPVRVVTPTPATRVAAPPNPGARTETQADARRKTWAIVSGTVGAVGLGVATGMILSAEHTYSNANCREDNHCTAGGANSRDHAIHTANWSMLPLGIGLAGLGAGITLWFAKPSRDRERPSAGLLLAPNQLGVQGGF